MKVLDKLPIEIVEKIYEMNPEHRENFQRMKKQIEIFGIFSRLHFIRKLADIRGLSDETALYNHVNDYEYMIEKLSQCNCCKRHSTKRPLSVNNPGTYISRFPVDKMSYLRCKCKCRHNSRWIFETFTSNHSYIDNSEEDDIAGLKYYRLWRDWESI